MGDVAIRPPEPEPDDFAHKLVELRNRMDDAAHVALTGDRAGRVRRPALYVIAFVCIGLGSSLSALTVVGLTALLLLALTDSVVEL